MKKQRLDLDTLLFNIIRIMEKHDPETLTFSKISRLANVPRSTLYYYFGNDKETMFLEAIRHGLKLFFGVFDEKLPQRAPTWEEYQREIFGNAVRIVKANPWVPLLYFKFYGYQGRIGKTMHEYQDSYIKNFRARWQAMGGGAVDSMNVKLLAGLKAGLLFAMSVDPESKSRSDEVVEMAVKLSRLLLEGKL